MKFADNTELVGKSGNDEDALYHKQTENSVNWCDKNYLYLNVSKITETCIDLIKNQSCPRLSKGKALRVEAYKHFGGDFGNRLNWKENLNSLSALL